MTKTGFDPKVCTIGPNDGRNTADSAPPPGDPRTADAGSDSSSDSIIKNFKGLVDGKGYKAESTTPDPLPDGPLANMIDAYNEEAQAEREPPRNPYEKILEGFAIGEAAERRPSAGDHTVPHVPDLELEVFKSSPTAFEYMEPIIQRYGGLERLTTKLINSTSKFLQPKYARAMTPGEIRALDSYLKKLKLTLRETRIQRDKASYYHSLATNMAADAAKKKP